jgi:hypothetical protein
MVEMFAIPFSKVAAARTDTPPAPRAGRQPGGERQPELGHAIADRAHLGGSRSRSAIAARAPRENSPAFRASTARSADCVSAWNKAPVGGVIGVQTGPQ